MGRHGDGGYTVFTVSAPGRSPQLCPGISDLNFLSDLDGIVNLDTEISNPALDRLTGSPSNDCAHKLLTKARFKPITPTFEIPFVYLLRRHVNHLGKTGRNKVRPEILSAKRGQIWLAYFPGIARLSCFDTISLRDDSLSLP